MDIDKIKTIHCVGVGGIGISAIARFFYARGAEVSGSDASVSDELNYLAKRGVNVFFSHSKENVPKGVDAIIFSPAVPIDNVELQEAKKLNIPVFSYPKMLGLIMRSYLSIAVSGTNGKTTTTALLGKFLEAAGKDPTVIVGGRVPGWDNNLRVGGGDLFIAEGCEYRRSMLDLSPRTIVLTNIEADHLDYYKDINDIVDAFTEYVLKLKKDDLLVYNIDDKNSCDIASRSCARSVSFGLAENADIRAENVIHDVEKQSFELFAFGKRLGVIETKIPGKFNIYNILGAAAAALDVGASYEALQRALDDFTGTWRRFERVGEIDSTVVISDYAHHPTAIKCTIKAVREFFPNKKILVVFQPHHQDRTIKLFDDFVESFEDADEMIIAEIYHVCGREEAADRISSKSLIQAIKKHGVKNTVSYAKDVKTAENMARERAKDFDVILVMGAGDIDEVTRRLVDRKKKV